MRCRDLRMDRGGGFCWCSRTRIGRDATRFVHPLRVSFNYTVYFTSKPHTACIAYSAARCDVLVDAIAQPPDGTASWVFHAC